MDLLRFRVHVVHGLSTLILKITHSHLCRCRHLISHFHPNTQCLPLTSKSRGSPRLPMERNTSSSVRQTSQGIPRSRIFSISLTCRSVYSFACPSRFGSLISTGMCPKCS